MQITATLISGQGTLSWQDPNNTLSCTDCLDPIATVQTDTEYEIEIETGGGTECSSSLSYTVLVEPSIDPILTDAVQLCAGDSRQLIIGNTVAENTYRITGGGVDITDINQLVSPTETTTYTVESTGRCGTSTQEITLFVIDDYTVTASGPATVCAGEPLTLNAAVDPSSIDGTYTWSLPNGTTQTGQQITVDNPSGGTYRVTFTDSQGCSSAIDEIEVEVLGQNILPRIEARLADGTMLVNGGSFFAGNNVTLTVGNVPDNINFTYDWAGNYNPATAQGREITVSVPRLADGAPEPLSYTVTLTAEGSNCTFETRIFLNVEQSQVVAPDFFTPDNDGRNDRFRLFYNGTITDYTLIVYNRWGQKVFTSNDPQEGWDGTKDGTPQNADTYLYLAKFRQDGAELQEEGQVSLLR